MVTIHYRIRTRDNNPLQDRKLDSIRIVSFCFIKKGEKKL